MAEGWMDFSRFAEVVDVEKKCRTCKETFTGKFWKSGAEKVKRDGGILYGVCVSCAEAEDRKVREERAAKRLEQGDALPDLEIPTMPPDPTADKDFPYDE